MSASARAPREAWSAVHEFMFRRVAERGSGVTAIELTVARSGRIEYHGGHVGPLRPVDGVYPEPANDAERWE